MKLLMFFVLPQFLSVSGRGSPTNWSHDDGAVFIRHPDDNLHPANHWSTAPSCPGIKFIENLVHTTSSARTSTAAAIKEPPLRQRASGHGGSAAMKLLMFFVLPQVTTMAGNEIGVITKQWSGLVKEYFTDADNFGVSFPLDMDVHCKAALLACTMLIRNPPAKPLSSSSLVNICCVNIHRVGQSSSGFFNHSVNPNQPNCRAEGLAEKQDYMFFERSSNKKDMPGMLD